MTNVSAAAAYPQSRFVVRLQYSTMGFSEEVTLPVTRIQSVGVDELQLSCAAGPAHVMRCALTESLKADRRALELYRAAFDFRSVTEAGTRTEALTLTQDIYTFGNFRAIPLDMDMRQTGPALEHAVLRGVRLLGTTHFDRSELPPDLCADVKSLVFGGLRHGQ